MLQFNMNTKFETPYTMVPNAFIDCYMSTENPVFVLIYLAFYRHCAAGTSEISAKTIAESLHILESDVINGLKYWQKKGLITFEENGLSICFLPVDSVIERESEKESDKPEPLNNAVDSKSNQAILMESRPNYSLEELEMYRNESKEIKNLFAMAEHVLGKLLSYNDMNVLFSLYDWLRLPINVIEVLLTYCADNNHRSMRYIEKAALDWAENEIETVDAAEAYIKLFNTDYREILKAFGHTRRNPTTSEIKVMKRWLNELQMPLDVILEACDKTIMQIGQPKFSYADKILTQWQAQGVRTVDEVKAAEDKFHAEKDSQAKELQTDKAKQKKSANTAAKPNRFVNFKQREWDYEQIERLEQQYLIDCLVDQK